MTKIAAIQSSRSQLQAYGPPKEESSESLLIHRMSPGTMILNEDKPIMENPVRDTKVTILARNVCQLAWWLLRAELSVRLYLDDSSRLTVTSFQ